MRIYECVSLSVSLEMTRLQGLTDADMLKYEVKHKLFCCEYKKGKKIK